MIASEILGLEPLQRLSRDIRTSAEELTTPQARYLVDLYYQIQEYRKRAGNQERAMGVDGEPHALVTWVFANMETLEGDIKRALDRYSSSRIPGRWAKSITGIGPVLSAGMLAHVDITQCPTVGHIWRFAGLDPTSKWVGKVGAPKIVKEVMAGATTLTAEMVLEAARLANRRTETVVRLATNKEGHITPASLTKMLAKRPWNAKLKTLCWLMGESFVKVCNHESDVYGHIYSQRKELEQARNDAGEFANQAAAALQNKKIGRDTDAYAAYSIGKLPPAHIHSRAKRYAVKLFLSHYHYVAYEVEYGEAPPKPYILTRPEHVHYIAPPNWPME